jgi:hypothetical protein
VLSPDVPAAIATDDAYVYWSTTGLYRAPLGGGTIELAASGLAADELAVDSSCVYFVSGGALSRLPKAGGPVATLVATGVTSAPLMSDTQNVYYNNSGTTKAIPK